jgi:hypothetical protein
MNNILKEQLKLLCRPKNDIAPNGYKTRIELENEWKMSRSQVMSMVTAGLKEGLIEKQLLMKDGRRTPYYGEPIKYKSTKPKR